MLKHTTVFVIALLLILSLTQSSARAVPSEPKTSEKKVVEDGNIPAEPMDERCEGEGDEECLMRRTLAAQVDYIYTQGKKP